MGEGRDPFRVHGLESLSWEGLIPFGVAEKDSRRENGPEAGSKGEQVEVSDSERSCHTWESLLSLMGNGEP